MTWTHVHRAYIAIAIASAGLSALLWFAKFVPAMALLIVFMDGAGVMFCLFYPWRYQKWAIRPESLHMRRVLASARRIVVYLLIAAPAACLIVGVTQSTLPGAVDGKLGKAVEEYVGAPSLNSQRLVLTVKSGRAAGIQTYIARGDASKIYAIRFKDAMTRFLEPLRAVSISAYAVQVLFALLLFCLVLGDAIANATVYRV